jgi:NAD(P)-dependent dehydrogenase (short-subunit alcohol dehydrogenase family)
MGFLDGKKAAVTGGSGVLGRAIALKLAREGAAVAILYGNSGGAARDTIRLVSQEGVPGLALQADLSREESVKKGFQELKEKWGTLDILVNNSGIFSVTSQAELSVDEWDRIWGVNMRGLFLSCREAFPLLREGAAVVNMASINAIHPGFGGTAHYDGSKGGVAAYTRSLAAEWAPRAIRVNAVAPGLVKSESLVKESPELVDRVETRTPLGGSLVKPEDVADSVLFLSSSLSSKITGQVLVVDGGYLLT